SGMMPPPAAAKKTDISCVHGLLLFNNSEQIQALENVGPVFFPQPLAFVLLPWLLIQVGVLQEAIVGFPPISWCVGQDRARLVRGHAVKMVDLRCRLAARPPGDLDHLVQAVLCDEAT